ncbi:MAG TPA: phage holin family protein [Candidatus Paceibacterota bacterium]|nr:phage holin family protein [Candidatus Paceibacterota bacterium]
MKTILRVIIVALAIMALPHFVAGISVDGIYPALIAAVIFGLLNLVVKPIINIVTLPINVITLGLFGLIVNGLLFWFVGSFVAGFGIATFTAALVGSLILAAVNWIAHLF